MVVADRDARLWRDFSTSDALLQSLRDDAKVVAPRPPKPLFIPGQSIIQFWAAWFGMRRPQLNSTVRRTVMVGILERW